MKALFEKYDLAYHEASLPAQVYSAWHKVVRLSLPNAWLATTTPRNHPQQLVLLQDDDRWSQVRRAVQARLEQQADKAA